MVPASFNESNVVLSRPRDLTAEQCDPLSVWRGRLEDGTPAVVSCWKLTADDLRRLAETGRVWLVVMGHRMPPVALTSESPFRQEGAVS